MKQQTISVNKNLIRVKTETLSLDNPNIRILGYDPAKKTHLIVQNTPKTKSSNRVIAISDGLCELLVRPLFTLQNSTWPNPENLLFPLSAPRNVKSSYFSAQYHRIAARRGKNRATMAVAHSILTVIWHILKHNVPYRDLGADYYDGFQREHKIRAYLKRLQALGWQLDPSVVTA